MTLVGLLVREQLGRVLEIRSAPVSTLSHILAAPAQEFCAAINAYDADVHGSQCPVCAGREKPLMTCSACGAGFHAACLALDTVPRVLCCPSCSPLLLAWS